MVRRLLDRIVLIHVPNRRTTTHDVSQSTLWNQRFSKIISHVSSAVGNIVQIGQWLHTSDGRTFLGECLVITKAVFGNSARRSRLAECWSCVLLAARKMGELTTAVEDDEIISHFNELLSPYVLKNQAFDDNPSLGTPSPSQGGDSHIVSKVEESLKKVIEGMTENEVKQFLRTDRQANIEERYECAVAIRLGKLSECMEKRGIEKTWNEKEVRDSVENFRLGKRAGEQEFYSPKKKNLKVKGCVLIWRTLFKKDVLEVLDKASNADILQQDKRSDLNSVSVPATKASKETGTMTEPTESCTIGIQVNFIDDTIDRPPNERASSAPQEAPSHKEIGTMTDSETTGQVITVGSDVDFISQTSSILPFRVQTTPVTPQLPMQRGQKRKAPNTSKDTSDQSPSSLEQCAICRTESNGVWVACEKCEQWFHCRCLSMPTKTAKDEEFKFVCSKCT